MWNKKDLEAKLKYLNELSRNTKDENKKYEIFTDKQVIIEMLELLMGRKLTIYDSPIFYKQKISLQKESKQYESYYSLSFLDLENDLKFCFELCKNLALLIPIDNAENIPSISKEECISEVIDFARKIKDNELSSYILNTINDQSHIYLSEITKESVFSKYSAVNFELSTFKESYIISPARSGELLHEIIHTIDSKVNGYYKSAYPYSDEVPSYTIEIYKNILDGNIVCLNEILSKAKKTILLLFPSIKSSILSSNDIIESLEFGNIENKTSYLVERLLTMKSYLIGVIFAKKILDNEEEGLKKFKEMFKTTFPIDKVPDYSRWGITNEVIIDYSKNLTNYFSEYQKERGGKSL